MVRIKELITSGKIREFEEVIRLRETDSILPLYNEGVRLYREKVRRLRELEKIRHERNLLSKEFEKTKDKNLIELGKNLKRHIKAYEDELYGIEKTLKRIELTLPNWLDEKVPIGAEENNLPIKYVGKPLVEEGKIEEFKFLYPTMDFKVTKKNLLHHYDLCLKFDLVDVKKSSEIAGSRFYTEKNELALLDIALALYGLKEFKRKGFKIVIPPFLIKKSFEKKIAYQESFKEALYEIKDSDLLLIPTAEHPLAALYSNTLLEETDLPIRIVSYTPAFRKEAGAHGKDTKGIFRVHHFNKVELHSIWTLDDDRKELDFLLKCVEEVIKPLNFPYRIVINASKDMDKRALIQYDIEAWFPKQNRYRETHSLATMGSWVSEKINTRVKRMDGRKEYAANLYATGIANQRTLLAILVNNYDPYKEVIKIPKPLYELSGIYEIS